MIRQRNVSVSFMLMGILFCTCLITSNLLETKILQFGTFTMTAGVLCFPISYILNDCICEVWGFRKTRLIIWTAFLMNFLVVALGQLAVMLPAADYWKESEPHFNFVFGLAPRIAASSFLAFLVGSFVNAYVMSRMKVSQQGRHFSVRAIASTLWGEGADSLIFFPLAFGGMMPVPELLKLMLLQVITKTAYEVLMLPLTIRVVRAVKQVEQTDTYDTDLTYNPLHVSDI
ncbi:MAG: queuosine precursor transporter [Bacteroidaceae bacterium]|nr:queuosine precursor transporter [Bacteroidaceae bacterium]MBQ7685463.1 queuosine precursor transporter [Bacteroidaceae bacterium]MBQ7988944.1 queuosine precursor transporter [Bacteroidaceae bacterium]